MPNKLVVTAFHDNTHKTILEERNKTTLIFIVSKIWMIGKKMTFSAVTDPTTLFDDVQLEIYVPERNLLASSEEAGITFLGAIVVAPEILADDG